MGRDSYSIPELEFDWVTDPNLNNKSHREGKPRVELKCQDLLSPSSSHLQNLHIFPSTRSDPLKLSVSTCKLLIWRRRREDANQKIRKKTKRNDEWFPLVSRVFFVTIYKQRVHTHSQNSQLLTHWLTATGFKWNLRRERKLLFS